MDRIGCLFWGFWRGPEVRFDLTKKMIRADGISEADERMSEINGKRMASSPLKGFRRCQDPRFGILNVNNQLGPC